MMRFKHGEHVVEGETPLAVVQAMRAAAPFAQARTDHEFAVQVAERAKISTGKVIRTDTLENFVEDLVRAGLLEPA